MVKSYWRGNVITYNQVTKQWSKPVHDICVRCSEPPTPEGHDACLGTLEGVKSACCGHGVEEPVIMREGG